MPYASPTHNLEPRLLNLVSGSLLSTGPDFTAQSDLFAAGLDSMAIMQLLLMVEEEFGVSIPAESVSRAHFSTVRSVAALIAARLGLDAPAHAPTALPAPDSPAPSPAKDQPRASFERLSLTPADNFVLGLDGLMRRTGQHGHMAHSLLLLDPLPDVAALRTLITTAAHHFPLLSARARRRWLIGPHEWVPAGSVAIPTLRLLCEAGSARLLEKHGAVTAGDADSLVEDVINTPLPPPGKGSMVAFTLIECRDGTARLILTWSHLIFDAIGAELFLTALQHLHTGTGTPPDALAPPPAPDPRHYGQRWQSTLPMVTYFYDIMALPFRALGAPRMTPGRRKYQIITLTPEQSATVTARAASFSGELVTMPFHLACVMRAHDRVFQHRGVRSPSLVTTVPVQVRKKGGSGPVFQNHLTMFFAALTAGQMDTLDGAVKGITDLHQRFLKERLDLAFIDLLQLMRPMPPALHMEMINRYMKGILASFYHSHTGEFAPGLDTFLGTRITSACHIPGFSNPPGTGLFCNEKHGRLIITLCWHDGCLTNEERRIMLRSLLDDYGLPGAAVPECARLDSL